MAFFEELGKKISQTGQGVVQKTKGTTGVMKLNGMIADEEKRMNLLYSAIGKKYFELHENSAEAELQGFVNEIKNAKKNIADYNEQIKNLKGFFLCPNCGNDVSTDSAFCPTCGLRMKSNAKACCTNCGEPVGEGNTFCINCGVRVVPATEEAPVAPCCTNCGEPIEDGASFCINCGTRV